MIHIIFKFADGDDRRIFNSTFDAYIEVLDAFNMHEEYFIGALRATTKKPIDIIAAQVYISQVSPVKEYLEYAAVAGFEDDQTCEDIQQIFHVHAPWVLSSWRKHMREYMKELEAFEIEHHI